MEGNCPPEIPSLPPPGDFGCVHELARSNLDTFAANGEDILRRTANAVPLNHLIGLSGRRSSKIRFGVLMLIGFHEAMVDIKEMKVNPGHQPSSLADDCTPWTNEKHSLYLTHLELSFVKHLHRSMDLIVQNSDKSQIDKSICQKRPANIQTAGEQFTVSRHGYCSRISNESDKPFSHVSSDTHNSLSSPCIDNFKHMQRYCQPISADMHQFLKLRCTKKHKNGKVMVSPQLATCSKQFSACKSDKADTFPLMKESPMSLRIIESPNKFQLPSVPIPFWSLNHSNDPFFPAEGMGQNFVDQDNSYNPKNKSQSKRLRTAVADCDAQEIP